MKNSLKLASAPALLAAAAMVATPAAAAELPAPAMGNQNYAPSQAWTVESETVNRYRHYRGWRGYRGYRGYRHRNRIGVGDVIAGAVIIGGIAAIVNAGNKNKRRYRDRDERYRDRDYRYDNRRGESRRSSAGNGLSNAASICVNEIERDVRVENVDSVNRTGAGWEVAGTLYNGEPFTCRIDSNGRLDGVDYGVRGASYAPAQDNQHSDTRYQSAWADVDRQSANPASAAPSGQQPAYPGGPIDGDLDQ
ncbi:hypothetical protein ACRAQ7_11225 [Erythrobacter sp. W53]|uniref:hypothetical protein n=1 Tax=Erythrobacter sp. W53 TaxID=3425947 RepID=UPI003D768846